MVRYVADMDEWDSLMEISNSKAVIVDFTASWCKFVERLKVGIIASGRWLLDYDSGFAPSVPLLLINRRVLYLILV